MLKKFTISFLLVTIFQSKNLFANEEENLLKLANSYPDFIKSTSLNKLIWIDGSEMNYDDNIQNKTFDEMISNPSLKDQMSIKYIKIINDPNYKPLLNEDPGRIRYEPFFKKMYGSSKEEVKSNLTKIKWMPKYSNKTILITKINNVDKKLQSISNELESLPKELITFIDNPAGGLNWRKISNTNRLSTHSFGIAIDVNVNHSDYWQWHKHTDKNIKYKNKIPMKIVEIFEKHGFIWGGRWYHYDTMHFEYRPELLN
jgi:peptidoglycan LD-endopeptidase CwlK